MMPQEQQNALAEQALKQQEATGQLSRYAAATQQAGLHTREYQVELAKLNAELDSVAGNTELERQDPAAYATAVQETQARIAAAQGQQGLVRIADQADLNQTKLSTAWSESMDEFVQRSRDTAAQIGDIFSSSLDGVNGSLATTLTAYYHTGRERDRAIRNSLSGVARGGAEKLTNVSLEKAEGSVLGAFGFGAGKKADGSQANPLWVRIAGAAGGASSAATGLFGHLFPRRAPTLATGGLGTTLLAAPDTSTVAKGLGADVIDSGVTKSILGGLIQGAFAGGGPVVADRPAIIGERGPELFVPHSAGTIVPNDKAFGGGDVHHHWNIDASSSHNPAETEAAVHRGIAKAMPMIASYTLKAQADHRARIAPSRRSA